MSHRGTHIYIYVYIHDISTILSSDREGGGINFKYFLLFEDFDLG